MALFTYVVASVLFWFLGIMPDLATMRDRAPNRIGQVLYGFLRHGVPRHRRPQWRHLKATYGTLAAIMAPLVVSVHSVVGLDFGRGGDAGVAFHRVPAVLRVRRAVVGAFDRVAADAGVPSARLVSPR